MKFFISYLCFQLSRPFNNFRSNLLTFIDNKTVCGDFSNIRYLRLINCNIGSYTYLGKTSTLSNLKVGSFSSVAQDFVILAGRHPIEYVSTSPCFYSIHGPTGICFNEINSFKEFKFIDDKYSCVIGSDVWIGYGVKVLDGLTIGHGAVVAAGSVVTKNVPPYEVWGGVPAKKISSRFDPTTVSYLLELNWWNKPADWLLENSKYFHDINELIKRNAI
jgi:acetyltransferase-like isoleucine patch superfamily enzyme